MAVLAMKRINIYALKGNRKRILEQLQLKGAIEVTSEKTIGDEIGKTFEKTDTASARALFEKSAQQAVNAVAVLDEIAEKPKQLPAMFAGRVPLSEHAFQKIAGESAELMKTASRILHLSKKITDGRANIIRYETRIDALYPWAELDVPMRTKGTKFTKVFIGSFPEPYTEAELKNKLAEILPSVSEINCEIISTRPQQTCVFILCYAGAAVEVERGLRQIGFTYPAAPSKLPPAERIIELQERIEEALRQIDAAENEIAEYADKREDLLFTADYYTARAEKYSVLGTLWQSKHVFVISGYVPAEDSEDIKLLLETNYEAHVELEEPALTESLPVKLKNNGYAAPVENVVEGYSLPSRGEVDPCSVMAIFYYVLFGMMLSDAAYGFLIAAGSAVILFKCKNMESGTRNTFKMFMYSGISTIFWGIMFGSYFGDALQVVSRTFFNYEIVVQPLWFAPLDDPMRLLLFSLLLGIIHLFTGLGVQGYQMIKSKRYKDAIYDVVFWYFLVGGLLAALLSTEMFCDMVNLGFRLPAPAGTVALVFAGVGCVGIIATAGRESRSFKRLLKGLYGIYNISGWLSDILSYSRLLALGLATGVIATVFNQMGSMLGGGVLGAIFFTAVFLVGHAMNLAINALGAYVHTNRLQYVEFFGKFYEGGGRKFTPFSTKTKYFKITEEK